MLVFGIFLGGLRRPLDLAPRTTKLIILNEEMNDIVKSLEDTGSLIRGVPATIKNEAKEQKSEFIGMLLGTLGTGLLGNMLV